jgi:hypothetical protein
MNRVFVCVAAGMFLFPLAAQETGGKRGGASDRFMRGTGGLVVREQPGASILILDARSSTDDKIEAVTKKMEEFCEVPFSVRRKPAGEGDTAMSLARAALADKGRVGVVVVLIDDGEDAPSLSVFPEDRIAFINTGRVCKNAAGDVAQGRVEKELWRAVCFAAGGVNTPAAHCVLASAVLKPEDLDKLTASMANPEACAQIGRGAGKFGLGRVQKMTYRRACMEGWAPAPTNEYQKAIWDAAKAKKPAKNP